MVLPSAPALNLKITQSSPSPAFPSTGTAALDLPSLVQILCEHCLGYISQELGVLAVGPAHVGFTSHGQICFPSGNFHVSTSSPVCRIVRLFNLGVSVKSYLIGAFNFPYLYCYMILCAFSCIYGPFVLPFLWGTFSCLCLFPYRVVCLIFVPTCFINLYIDPLSVVCIANVLPQVVTFFLTLISCLIMSKHLYF